LCSRLIEQGSCGSAADRRATEQFRGNQFGRPPDSRIGEQMFDFVEQATLEAGNLLLAARALRRKSPHGAQVLLRSGPRIFARVTSFRGSAAEQDQDFDLDRIVCRLDSTLLQFALPEPELIGQDADALHISAERQRDDCMPCFVISGRKIDRRVRSWSLNSQSLFLLVA
jgi:hypothetical protein